MDDITKIRLEKILESKIVTTEILKGGSEDKVYLLICEEEKYIFKSGFEESIDSQIAFYKTYYKLPYLPKLIYANKDSNEFIIKYLQPNKSREKYNKKEILSELISDFISKYKSFPSSYFGFVSGFQRGDTFAEFLVLQAKEAYKDVIDLISASEFEVHINRITENFSKDFEQKYLIHGDLGFHNFFYSDSNITGIIDPDPIVGHPLYDLMFAYCSTPELINESDLTFLLGELNIFFKIDQRNWRNYMLVGLFKRVSSSRKHHPNDLDQYLKLWTYFNV